MKTKFIMIAATSLMLALASCGGGVDSPSVGGATQSGSNSGTLDQANFPNSFSLVTTVGFVGSGQTATHVRQVLEDSAGNALIDNGANDTGSMTTSCTQSASNATTITYSCTTTYNLNSPLGNPAPVTKSILLTKGQVYTAKLIEMKVLAGTSTTTSLGTLNP